MWLNKNAKITGKNPAMGVWIWKLGAHTKEIKGVEVL